MLSARQLSTDHGTQKFHFVMGGSTQLRHSYPGRCKSWQLQTVRLNIRNVQATASMLARCRAPAGSGIPGGAAASSSSLDSSSLLSCLAAGNPAMGPEASSSAQRHMCDHCMCSLRPDNKSCAMSSGHTSLGLGMWQAASRACSSKLQGPLCRMFVQKLKQQHYATRETSHLHKATLIMLRPHPKLSNIASSSSSHMSTSRIQIYQVEVTRGRVGALHHHSPPPPGLCLPQRQLLPDAAAQPHPRPGQLATGPA